MTEGPLDVTVYIPCYNGASFLDRVLPAVKAQTYEIVEILVVDDGSSDDSAAIARRHGVRVIEHERNRGLGAARNTGVREAKTGFVACLDADVVPTPSWLARLCEEISSRDLAGVSGDLRESVLETLGDRWRDAHMRQSWGGERLDEPRFLYGNNGLYRREALVEAGLYDESCWTNGEDIAMTEALREHGYRVAYTPAAVCHHLRSDDFWSISRTYWRWLELGVRAADLRTTLRVTRRVRRVLLRDFMREDWHAGRRRLAAIDALMYLHWIWMAWRQLFANLAKAAPPAEPPRA